MELSDLIVAIHLGRDNGKISFCNLLRRTCHIFKRSCNRVSDLVEETAEEKEGDECYGQHSPFEGVHIAQYFVLRNEENERPSRLADGMNDIVVLNACVCVGKENRIF